MKSHKPIAILSTVLGAFFGFGFYLFLGPGKFNSLVSLLGGLLFCLSIYVFFLVYGAILEKKYAKFEKNITSPIFYKTNGNFNLGNGKLKNGNIYFCESGIVCVCLEEKPYTLDEILLQDIEKYQIDTIHLNIFAKDGRVFVITTPDADMIKNVLKEKNWIEG